MVTKLLHHLGKFSVTKEAILVLLFLCSQRFDLRQDLALAVDNSIGECYHLDSTEDAKLGAVACGQTSPTADDDIRGLCQFRECRTKVAHKYCSFPFRYASMLTR